MITFIKNLFTKKEQVVPEPPKTYKTKIKLELCYIEGEFNPKMSLPKYVLSTTVESDVLGVFEKEINNKYFKYGGILRDVNKQLEDPSVEYIKLQDNLLIKKKDFVNIAITSENL